MVFTRLFGVFSELAGIGLYSVGIIIRGGVFLATSALIFRRDRSRMNLRTVRTLRGFVNIGHFSLERFVGS